MGSPSSRRSAGEGNHLSQTKNGFKQARSTLKTCQGRVSDPSSFLYPSTPAGPRPAGDRARSFLAKE